MSESTDMVDQKELDDFTLYFSNAFDNAIMDWIDARYPACPENFENRTKFLAIAARAEIINGCLKMGVVRGCEFDVSFGIARDALATFLKYPVS